jgi:hypothetical protein
MASKLKNVNDFMRKYHRDCGIFGPFFYLGLFVVKEDYLVKSKLVLTTIENKISDCRLTNDKNVLYR